MGKSEAPLRVAVEDGRLVIEIGLDTLKFCAENHPAFWDGESDDTKPNIPVNDAVVFGREVCRAMNDEGEDGSTLVTRMVDAAIERAVEGGCEGVSDEF